MHIIGFLNKKSLFAATDVFSPIQYFGINEFFKFNVIGGKLGCIKLEDCEG